MMITVHRSDLGGIDAHEINNGSWIVDDNGALHLRDGQHVKTASYAPSGWKRVHRGVCVDGEARS